MYDKLYKELSSDHMEMYREKAAKQAKTAMEHFQDDFVYKIRSAIREAYQRRDRIKPHDQWTRLWERQIPI